MPARGKCLTCGSTKIVIVGEDSYLKTRPHSAIFLDMSVNTFRAAVEPELPPPIEGKVGGVRWKTSDLVEWSDKHRNHHQKLKSPRDIARAAVQGGGSSRAALAHDLK